MLSFKPIELEDKTHFEKFTLCHGYHNLEASFANIFIWRRAWNIQMAADELALYLHLSNGKISFSLPPFLDDCDTSMVEPLKRYDEFFASRGEKPHLKGVTTELKEKIERDCPGWYTFTADRDNFEYVYNAEDLITLQGKKYHAKRNHINKFLKEHTFEYRRYTKDDYSACIELQEKWMETKGIESKSFENELLAAKDALTHIDELGLKCGMLYVDGNLEAYSIGEKFDDMAIIHVEKANPDIQGVFALINREFASHEFSDVVYINREEDMGIEGLRKAKLSYYPVCLKEKFVGVRNQ